MHSDPIRADIEHAVSAAAISAISEIMTTKIPSPGRFARALSIPRAAVSGARMRVLSRARQGKKISDEINHPGAERARASRAERERAREKIRSIRPSLWEIY